ncbi:MAG: hypothetical protein Q8S18_01085 [Bacteroidales bacterium]|nr:hypothetical protein [Bacteroidales bacterium]
MKAQMIAIAMFLNLITFSKSINENHNIPCQACDDYNPYKATEIALQFNLSTMVIDSIKHAEELYVDDIPFNTEAILLSYRSDSAMVVKYELKDEGVINDIPFDTQTIASQNLHFKNAEVSSLNRELSASPKKRKRM